jgi:tRNA pseudouridine13 synthase
LRSTAVVRELEQAAIEPHAALARGLEREGLSQERRALRLVARDFCHAWESGDCLVVEFGLGAGSFATTLLRELCDWHAALA